MKTIVITGGAGFIGSHLTRKQVELGNRVIVIDNLITTGDPRYIQDLILDKKISFIQADICNPNLMMKVKDVLVNEEGEDYQIDEVFNLASPASVKLYTHFPELTYATSTIGVKNMINIARALGTKEVRFLETSTSEIYGDPEVHPQVEDYFGNVNTQCERSCYDEGKRGAEVLCYLAHKIYGVNTHIARLFNVYGPNNTDDRVMPTFIMQAMKGEDITVFGDGSQTRSFCYVEDLVEGLIKLQASNYNSPVNLGNPEEVTVNDLANIINGKFGNKSKITYHPLPEFDPTKRCPNIQLAMKELNWHPEVSLREGVDKVIEWMKEILK